MKRRINFKCDKCGGPVWKDVEFSKHIEMSCLYCGKLWFVDRKILDKVLKKKLYEKYVGTRGAVIS